MYKNIAHILTALILPFSLLGQVNSCPEVAITNITGGKDILIDCNSGTGCIDLMSEYPKIGATTDYTIESIEYNPTYPYAGLANPLSVHIDDVWSDPKVILPFNFCFYGQTYSEVVISSNGAISFDISNINDNGVNTTSPGVVEFSDECAWGFNLNIPNAQFPNASEPKKILNAIYGVFHDIDPSINGSIGWEVFGTYPCRTLVVGYNNVPLFSCNDEFSTFQMVLFESTNIIEIYIRNRSTCSGWNNGNGLVGIQNANGSQGLAAPGRNTGNWTANNEAWRIVPSGVSTTQVTWYDVTNGNQIISNADDINVCLTTENIYRVEVEFTLCDGSIITTSDTATVSFEDTIIPEPPIEYRLCDEDDNQDGLTLIDLTLSDTALNTELNTLSPTVTSYHLSLADAQSNSFPILSPSSFTNTTEPQSVFGRIEDMNAGCILIKRIYYEVTKAPDSYDAIITTGVFANEHQIVATATGNTSYLFDLDDGGFQTSGVFNEVSPGLHIVTITDVDFCFEIEIRLIILDYPRFFTPNGDGYNDSWKINNRNEFHSSTVYIYDRFGKHLMNLAQQDKIGWNGLYNGNPLPASDYWFTIIYKESANSEEKEFVGHFTLKR